MKKQREEEGGQEWLNTYADMMTLVLTFSVLLYSVSNVNIGKLEEIASAMQRQLGIESQTELEDMPDDFKYPTISENTDEPSQVVTGSQNTQVSVRGMRQMPRDIRTYSDFESLDAIVLNTENAVYIRFKNDLLFNPDGANLRDGSKPMLDAAGVILQEKQDNTLAAYINGHTAQVASSLINDRILSSEWADNVAIYLEEQVGLNPKELICRGYGKYYPIVDNTTKEEREQNHWVDMITLGNGYEPPESAEGVEIMGPLFPVVIPQDEAMMQEGTTSD